MKPLSFTCTCPVPLNHFYFCLCISSIPLSSFLVPHPSLLSLPFLMAMYPPHFSRSAGVGRTGSLITIDVEIQRAGKEKCVDPFNTVTQLRQQRNHMVQTEAQYVFIHDAILEAISSGNTEVAVDKLSQHMKQLEHVDEDQESGYQKEFQVSHASTLSNISYLLSS